MEEDENNI